MLHIPPLGSGSPGEKGLIGKTCSSGNTVYSVSRRFQGSKTKVFIYKEQRSLHIRKAGFITLLFAPSWYIGDNKKEVALMVSEDLGQGSKSCKG